jgi:hypothetical protein
MIHDAKVEVSCDGDGCLESIEIGLPFRFPNYSGKGGRYDHRAEAVHPLIRKEGWRVTGDDDDAEHLCPECAGPEGRDREEG